MDEEGRAHWAKYIYHYTLIKKIAKAQSFYKLRKVCLRTLCKEFQTASIANAAQLPDTLFAYRTLFNSVRFLIRAALN